MIRHIFKKDWKLLWPMVALITAIQIGRQWAVFKAGLFGEIPAAVELLRPLTLAWFGGIAALIAAVVHQDPVPGVDQDWLIRPLRRTDLLLAKLSFLLLAISVPMFALDLAQALAMGFPVGISLQDLLYKGIYVFISAMVPALALAATTRNMTELTVLGAALIVVFAVSLGLSAALFGESSCPTCETGVVWLQHLLQHVGVSCGAGIILALQYYRRRTEFSRALAILGAVALVFVQLSWNSAFAVQSWLSRSAGPPAAITITIDA